MTSILFNPITIALASMAAIVMATAFVPTDAWDRIKDRFWHSDSQGEIIPRQWPWEKH